MKGRAGEHRAAELHRRYAPARLDHPGELRLEPCGLRRAALAEASGEGHLPDDRRRLARIAQPGSMDSTRAPSDANRSAAAVVRLAHLGIEGRIAEIRAPGDGGPTYRAGSGFRTAAAQKSSGGEVDAERSVPIWLASAPSRRAASPTVRAIGPLWPRAAQMSVVGHTGTRPSEGLESRRRRRTPWGSRSSPPRPSRGRWRRARRRRPMRPPRSIRPRSGRAASGFRQGGPIRSSDACPGSRSGRIRLADDNAAPRLHPLGHDVVDVRDMVDVELDRTRQRRPAMGSRSLIGTGSP